MLPSLGIPELVIILVLVLIVFGAGKLPNVMKSMGEGVKEFREASEGTGIEGGDGGDGGTGGDGPATTSETAPAEVPTKQDESAGKTDTDA